MGSPKKLDGIYRRSYVIAETHIPEGAEGRIHAVVSTERRDRAGDIIRQEGWDLSAFKTHPVLLVNHNYTDIQAQIGEWESMEVKGTQMVGVARYYVGEGNPNADWAFRLAGKGRAAFSVGFKADMAKATVLDENEDDWRTHYEFNGQELLEVSQVMIPANPDALQVLSAFSFEDALMRLMQHRCPAKKHASDLQEVIAQW